MKSPAWRVVRDILILILMFMPSYIITVMFFLIGFLIIPNGVPSPHVSYTDYSRFYHAAINTQDFVFYALIAAVVLASAARVAGVRLINAVRIEFALNGVYWISLLAVYIAGLVDGAFVASAA